MTDDTPDPAKGTKQRREEHPNRKVHRERFDTGDPYDAVRDRELTGGAPVSGLPPPKYSVKWWNRGEPD